VFQQVSLRAASAIMHRLIVALAQPVKVAGLPVPLYQFPSDVFPANDTGVASNIVLVAGSEAFHAPSVLTALGERSNSSAGSQASGNLMRARSQRCARS